MTTGDGRHVVLGVTRTPLERRLVDEFVAASRDMPDSALIDVTYDAARALAVAERDDATIAPVGVAWLPPERKGEHRFSITDARSLSDPSRPRLRAQERILERSPGRCQVVVGDAARRSELLSRWADHSGRPADRAGLEEFVERQARLALDRAERATLGARYKTAQAIVEDLVASRRFRAGVSDLVAATGRDAREVQNEAEQALAELASVQNRFARDVWVQLAHFLWDRAYDVDVDTAGLERLRELNRQHPLVFLPSHKSNLDGFVMASVLYDHGFPQNHVIGGKNMAFWPLGMLGRRVGVVWIRRSFGGDAVYKFALRRYLAHLASKRFNLEWYIEGGRSRSGKLLPPRMGLINYLAQGVEEAGVDEVLLAPVSIVYDRLNEVLEMTAEARGAVKQPEGLRWLIGYARKQRGELGTVQVRFGEPVALRAALSEAPTGDRAARSLALSKVAFEVCTRINKATPVTPISVVTLALLGMDGWAATLGQTLQAIAPLLAYIERRALPGSEALSPLHTSEGVLAALSMLVEDGVVERFDGVERVYRIGPERELAASFYRNVAIHWFVNRAIVELALVTAAESGSDGDPISASLAEARRLRDLLKFEFFFSEKRAYEAELRDEVALIEPAWREHGGTALHDLGETLAQSGALIADRVLRSFLEAYFVVADRLLARGGANVLEPEVIQESLRVGRQYQLQRRIVSAEAISTELYKTGLRLAENRDLLHGDAVTLANRREAFVAELQDVLRRLEILRGWERANHPRREGEVAARDRLENRPVPR